MINALYMVLFWGTQAGAGVSVALIAINVIEETRRPWGKFQSYTKPDVFRRIAIRLVAWNNRTP